ncbi:GntR family transcriptional regulator [Rhodoferax sp. GW822-FHT02A01]|uniref:GntR family transcriptional regulator n=1 Tax=Rhodoferax sp. GW822-FHT02A01 TaxID=3141537 RepID=UPI00315CB76F
MSLPEFESQQPKYALVAQSLLLDIRAGRFSVGSMLPTEENLSTQYGVSRQTVRAALKLLSDKGYVKSQRPLGTKVIAAKEPKKQTLGLSSVNDLVQLTAGSKQMITSIQDVLADEDLATEIGCPIGRAWKKVELLRWLSDSVGAPSMLSRLWINPIYGRVTDGLHLNKILPVKSPFIEQIETLFGEKAVEIRQNIGAVLIDGELAKALHVPECAPGLRIQRWVVSRKGDLIFYSDATYNGGTFTYQTTLRLSE